MDHSPLTTLNWFWIGTQLVVPPLVALALAYPFWRKGGAIFGNIVGTALLFGVAFSLIMREYVELDRLTKACLDEGAALPAACFANPSPFTRFAIYAGIGLLEVFVLFGLSLRVEKQLRDRDYAPEWR